MQFYLKEEAEIQIYINSKDVAGQILIFLYKRHSVKHICVVESMNLCGLVSSQYFYILYNI